jgi:poly-gamma-glutamate synthesis protein (capsule biosynthesis protein)
MAVASINLDESNSHKLIQSVARSISLAKEKKSDVIMVYYHWGAEHVERVTDEQIRIAVQTAEAGADIVVGTHQHFVQGIRRYVTSDGRTVPLCFGLGHVVFGAIPNPKEKWSIILECVFQRDSKTGRMLLKGAQSIPIVTDPTFTKDDAFQPYSCMGIKRRRFLNLLRRRSASIALPR